MSYFTISCNDAGVYVLGPFSKAELTRRINEWAEDIKSEYQPIFLDKMPEIHKGYFHFPMGGPKNGVVIIKGEIVVPKPVEVVTTYEVE